MYEIKNSEPMIVVVLLSIINSTPVVIMISEYTRSIYLYLSRTVQDWWNIHRKLVVVRRPIYHRPVSILVVLVGCGPVGGALEICDRNQIKFI